VGFFSKIFGGKKADTGEIQTVSGEQPVVNESVSDKPAPEPETLPEEDRVPEPVPVAEPEPKPEHHHSSKKDKKKNRDRGEHKPTVFGMAAPSFTQPDQESPDKVVAGEIASGEVAAGELVIGAGSSEAAQPDVSGSMVIGGEVTLGQTSSGEIVMDEVSVAAPIVRQDDDAQESPAEEPETSAVPAAAAIPASATESGSGPVARTSGARPAILDDEDHSDVDLFPKAEQKDLRSSIDCGSCRHRLPVPYVGYPARITCPFCLNVNEYNL
jgi:outer membrane biosynthesis protein TonB